MLYGSFDNWSLELYKQHIALLNGGFETPNSETKVQKSSINDFVKMFKYLINGFIKNEYREERLNVLFNNNMIHVLKGAHRIACCLYFNKKVSINHKLNSHEFVCKPIFFEDRSRFSTILPRPGHEVINKINSGFLDIGLLEFIKLNNKRTRLFYFITPNKSDTNRLLQIDKLFTTFGIYVGYFKMVLLSKTGLVNFSNEFGIDFDSSLISNYNGNYLLQVMVLESDEISIKLIDRPRSSDTDLYVDFKKEKSILHKNIGELTSDTLLFNFTTDSIKSSNSNIYLSQVLFNNNTIEFYNNFNIRFTASMSKLFNRYKENVESLDSENYCLTGNFVRSLYKSNKLKSLEYIHNKTELDNNTFKSHNSLEKSYKDIIYNPKNYFYIRGVKCCNVSLLSKV